jgi:endo-1,4-beta-xylanase
MKNLNLFLLMFSALLAPSVTHLCLLNAQLADGHGKYLGNLHYQGQIPANFDYYWNQVTPENSGKWASCEQNRDDFNYWSWLDTAYGHAKDNGYPFKEHTMVWGHSSGEPAWMSGLSESEQLEEVIEWFEAVAERYPDIDMVDVVNEPLHDQPGYKNALGGDGATGWDWVIWSFEKAREVFPNAQLILNEYNILNYSNETQAFLQIVDLLQSRGLIDGIGCESHSLENIPVSTIQQNLNTLAATGLDIYISELELRGDDQTQLSLYQNIFPILYEHPSVKGVTLWGYIQGEMWRNEAYLVSSGGVERPAMHWLKEYFGYDTEPGNYTLTTNTTGVGTISLSPAGGSYTSGTQVTLTANAGSGYEFSSWSGDLSGSANPATITMVANRSVTANFQASEGGDCDNPASISLPFVRNGAGQYCFFTSGDISYINSWNMQLVEVNGVAFTNVWSNSMPARQDGGYYIYYQVSVGWAHLEINGTNNGGDPEEYSLTTSTVGSGSISLSPAGGTYGEGAVVTLTAIPGNGYEFSSWSGALSGSANPATLTMNSEKSVTATFTAIVTEPDQYTLTVSASGNGSVTVNPSAEDGIYDEGTIVTLTANAANGYQFAGWSGDLNGASNPATISITSNMAVIASFEEVETGDGCDNPVAISAPFTQNGSGQFCWFTTDEPNYVNSWNLALLEINGADFTNTWANSFPARIDGGYYIYYDGPYGWSHFEMSGPKSAVSEFASEADDLKLRVFPNPANAGIVTVDLQGVTGEFILRISDMSGSIVKEITADQPSVLELELDLRAGLYLIRVTDTKQSKVAPLIIK